jgi:vanadium chloroperoxidase
MGPTATPGNDVNEQCDSGWLPLGAPRSNSKTMEKNFTPPFPAYPSGHATFGAAAFHITRRFYGTSAADRSGDNLFANRSFVSEELDGFTRDNKGTIRPRHDRNFADGLWQMILENGLSRVYLGVHWVFDAFAVESGDATGTKPDFSRMVGGVPLGLAIANDIFDNGLLAANGAKPVSAAPTISLAALTSRKPWPQG